MKLASNKYPWLELTKEPSDSWSFMLDESFLMSLTVISIFLPRHARALKLCLNPNASV